MLNDNRPLVSIIIKALNEECHIASAIESALAAIAEVGGEVILADSASSDRTVEIAQRYPIRIVQLSDIRDRSCGAGAQLGYQHAGGRYIYLLDGDMTLRTGFLPAAIRRLEKNATVAGVGGTLTELETDNHEFVQRVKRGDLSAEPGPVLRLDGGGLYRRSAVEAVGYFTDRNLHGGEEGELGARLRARGFTLERIAVPAVDHRGHSGSGYRLLLRRITSRNACGSGETLRAALGRPHFPLVFQNNGTLKLALVVHAWWASILACALFISPWPLAGLAMAALIAFPVVIMALRWRSLDVGLYSVVAWNVYALCLLPGFLRPRVPPTAWIDSTVVKDATPGATIEPFPRPRVTAARHDAAPAARSA
ncbi:MAG: glycosyltransferase [Xanthobacteraceae bacterium]|nr:glycosyltransferase [Xanthobacteraceae bacterium]